jgi:hypothetical protein
LQGVLAQSRVRASTRQALAAVVLSPTPDGAAEWVRDMLTEAIGAGCPEATGAAVTSGATDPYSLDAYTHTPPGAAARTQTCSASCCGAAFSSPQKAAVQRTSGVHRRSDGQRHPRSKRVLQQTHADLGPSAD